MLRNLWTLAVVALVATPVIADPVDDIVDVEMRRQHIPGLSLAVVRNGKVIKEAGYGLANLEHEVKVTPATIFQSGSVGKQFTAALVLLLAQDGKLKLDDPVSTHLPGTPDSWKLITLRHLLNHTSGLPSFDPAINLKADYSEDELLRSAVRVAPEAAPGERWSYSNLGYQLLGFICSRTGGRFYGEQLRERIFAPLGMQSRIISEQDIIPHRAAGYLRVGGQFRNQEWVSPTLNTTADGSLYMTARDLARWSLALETSHPLSEEMKTTMWTPARLNDGRLTDYGFGWMLGDTKGHRIHAHSGSWQGFNSFILRFPDDRLAVMVLANRDGARLPDIVHLIAAHYLPMIAAPAPPPLTAKLLDSTPLFVSGTLGDKPIREGLRRIAPGLFELQIDLDAGWLAVKIESADGAINLGSEFDEQATRLGESKPLVPAGDHLVTELKHRTTYVFRFDARDLAAMRFILREVTQ